MKKHKWFTILLALGMAGCMTAGFAACRSSSDEEPPAEEPPAEEEENMIEQYRIANGLFVDAGKTSVVSASVMALAVREGDTFAYGSLSATFTHSGNADNGIVFGLSAPASGSFWEGYGISYYFFFLDTNGTVRLGKTDNGLWTNCAETPGGFTDGSHTLKVERDDITINCYVDDVLYLSFTDSNPLLGTDYGLRAGAVGVAYSNVQCESQSEWVVETSENFESITGSVVKAGIGDRTRGAALSLHKTARLAGGNGTLTVALTPAAGNDAGVVFGADDAGNSYYTFGFTSASRMELAVVRGGAKEVLGTGVLSAGYSASGMFTVDIVKNGGEIGCYLHYGSQIIRYAAYTDSNPLTGERVGLYSSGAGATYGEFEATALTSQRTAETLFFGHSYMELWSGYKTDFPEYTDIDNIGIGGSVASQWEDFIDEIVAYRPSRAVYMIGINDLTGGISPRQTAGSVEYLLGELHAALPNLELVLVGVNYCPARSHLTAEIAETNKYFKNIAAKNDWVNFADVEWTFNTSADDPQSTNAALFTDGLHPTALGYKLMATQIKSAFAGENQPEFDESVEEDMFLAEKQTVYDSISMYSQNAYRASEWEQASAYYETMVERIEACTTSEQLRALDFSTEIAALSVLKSNAAYVTDNVLSAASGMSYNTQTWSKNEDGSIRMFGESYSLDTTAQYTDTDVVFSLFDNTGVIPTGGIFLRATRSSAGGIDGYLISYVTDLNYIQIYYVENGYSLGGGSETYTYLGGWVYPGSVVGTTFYVRIQGSMLYLADENTIARYGFKDSIAVNLAYGADGTPVPAVYQSGYTGVLCWANGRSCSLMLQAVVCEQPSAASLTSLPAALIGDNEADILVVITEVSPKEIKPSHKARVLFYFDAKF